MIRRWISMLVLLGLSTILAHAQSQYYAKCQEVINGHTVVVFHHNEFATIRLREAVCPVKAFAYWQEATQFTKKLVEKRMCQVLVYEEGEDDEHLGEIVLPDGRYLSRALIEAGWAWWNEPEGISHVFALKEKKAREEGLGMWARRPPKPPWIYQKERQENREKTSGSE